jgi:hypothetical protein
MFADRPRTSTSYERLCVVQAARKRRQSICVLLVSQNDRGIAQKSAALRAP